MIRFRCGQCGREITVADAYAGKKGRCPQCRLVLHIPQPGKRSPTSAAGHSGGLITTKEDLLLDLPQAVPEPADQEQKDAPSGEGIPATSDRAEAEDNAGEKPAGWADALLYPANVDGLVQIGIVTFALWAVGLFGVFTSPFLQQYSGLLVTILRLIIAGYTVFYLSYCIFDSSRGGRRAATVSLAHTPDLWDLLSQLLLLLASVAMCFWPAAVYYVVTERADTSFGVLAASGAFFFPMTLLTATLFDGIDALNPILIVRSILVTLPAYLVLIVQLGLPALLLAATNWASARLRIPQTLRNVVYLYLLLIGSHLLGRFYCRRRNTLGWGL